MKFFARLKDKYENRGAVYCHMLDRRAWRKHCKANNIKPFKRRVFRDLMKEMRVRREWREQQLAKNQPGL